MSRDHRKLRAFHGADGLVLETYRLTRDLPFSERFGLQFQIRRAAVSVPTNIVEGSARTSETEYKRFLEIARASAAETEYLLGLSVRLELLPSKKADSLVDRYSGLQKVLFTIAQRLS